MVWSEGDAPGTAEKRNGGGVGKVTAGGKAEGVKEGKPEGARAPSLS